MSNDVDRRLDEHDRQLAEVSEAVREQGHEIQDMARSMRDLTDALRDLTEQYRELHSWKLKLTYPLALIGVVVVGFLTAVGASLLRFIVKITGGGAG